MKPMQERALVFECRGDPLIGVLHEPVAAGRAGPGVLVVVGGPQYRAGSHRQFVVLARALAEAGYPVLRFDHRGIGDSDGAPRSFEELDDDMRAAIDALFAARPELDRCVIFGLCDAASAAMMYCPQDRRLVGLILANPWVHSEAGVARAYVKHYYLGRLLQASFWRKVAAGEFDAAGSLRDLLRKLWLTVTGSAPAAGGGSFQDRMLDGLRGFQGHVLLLISGRDLTAAEFTDLCGTDDRWQAALARPGVQRRDYPESDHTFSDARGLAASVEHCTAWLGAFASR